MRLQPIYDIAERCARQGVTHAILCPGSRCAPLTLAFARHTKIKTRTISDERSAAFIATGIAQRTRKATVLVCTSGSAAYNFSPAVAEAFFAQVPLLVFTADRPAEWIAQQDGQTIYQTDLFGKHVKKSYNVPQQYDHADDRWAIDRIVNEAINLAHAEPAGPVHINVPLREPLYPAAGESIVFSDALRIVHETHVPTTLTDDIKIALLKEWTRYHRILLVGGQQRLDETLRTSLQSFSQQHSIPVIGDVISNLHALDNTVRRVDLFLGQAPEKVTKTLQPDLLITFGNSVISKNLKLYLRQHAPQAHWHIQAAGPVADSFQSITRIIRTSPHDFFDFMASFAPGKDFDRQKQSNYHKLWEVEERRSERVVQSFFPQEKLNELELVHDVMQRIPGGASLHLANSMSVRYANFIGMPASADVEVFSNRGTSGIDGCTSTAVGHALADERLQILITGDLAFFYDRNAFWHSYPMPNLRIVLLNNHGGIIFTLIDGPAALPESSEYFVTRQRLTAAKLCEEFDFDHLKLDNRRKLKNILNDFFEPDGRTKILELESSLELNKELFERLKEKTKNSYES